VAIAPGGNVLVVDRANNRVGEFTSTGGFVRAWGFGVDSGASAFETCTTASGCQAGVAGAAAGQLSDGNFDDGVSGVATNAVGDIFLADDTNNRVAQYAATPVFTRAWGFGVDTGANAFEECTTASGCQQGAASAGAGGLANPADLSVDSFGRVVVVDYQTDRVIRYADPPPPSPTITDTDPDSPANDSNPEVKGTAAAGLTVKIYATSDCTGPPLATGTAALFASPGITTPVPLDATTNLRATTTDALNNPSACSTPFPYTEDSTALPPSLTATDPASPANENSPKVKGNAEAGSAVKLFTTSDCSGAPAATGTAEDLAGAGIAIAVADNSTTAIRAVATDPVGNVSACSAPTSYVEVTPDTTPPETSIGSKPDATVKTKGKSAAYSISFSSNEPATFRCSLDGAPFTACASPATGKAKKGPHTFSVVATDTAGNPDATAATASWKVKRKKHKH
jgi:hypothetical protein